MNNKFTMKNDGGLELSFVIEDDKIFVLEKYKLDSDSKVTIKRQCDTFATGNFAKYLLNSLLYSKEHQPIRLSLSRWYEHYDCQKLMGYGYYYILTNIRCKGKRIGVEFDTVNTRLGEENATINKYKFTGYKKVDELISLLSFNEVEQLCNDIDSLTSTIS